MTLTAEQSAQLSDLIQKIYSTGGLSLEELCVRTVRLMKAEYYGINLLPNMLAADFYSVSNNPDDFMNAYTSELHKDDFILQALSMKPVSPLRIFSLVDRQVEKSNYFFNECRRIRPAGDGFYMPITDQGVMVGIIAFCREGNRPPCYGPNDQEILSFLLPFLNEGVRRTCLTRSSGPGLSGSGLSGRAILDGYGTVLEYDDESSLMLQEAFGPRYALQPLRSTGANGTRFSRRFHSFITGLPNPRDAEFTLQLQDGFMKCSLSFIGPSMVRRHFPHAPQVLMALSRQENNPERFSIDNTELTGSFGLTSRESEVAFLIRSGFSNAEISRRLGISTATVKRHIYNIFNKVGTDSRTQLVYVLSSKTGR